MIDRNELFQAVKIVTHVYNNNVLGPSPDGFIYLEQFHPANFRSMRGAHADDSLRAVVYQAKHSNEIIIGFRGTDNAGNLVQDADFVFKNALHKDCRKFVREVIETVIQKYPHNNISLTGHSLGGAMSIYGSLLMGFRSIGFDIPYIGDLPELKPAHWNKVTLVKANSTVTSNQYDDKPGIKIIKLNNRGALSNHFMENIFKQLVYEGWIMKKGQMDKLGKLYRNFGGDPRALNIPLDIREKINKMHDDLYLKNEKANDAQIIAGANNFYSEIGRIGVIVGSRDLIKIQQIGQCVVRLHEVMSPLATLPLALSLTKISACLNPIMSIVGVGFQIASLFGFGRRRRKRSSGINLQPIVQPILNAVRAVHEAVRAVHEAYLAQHQEMRASFQLSFQNQQQIYAAVIKLGDYMINDFKLPVMEYLASLDDEVQRLQIINGEEHQAIYLQHLCQQVSAMSTYIDGDLNWDEDKVHDILNNLRYWVTEGSCNAILNGAMQLQGHRVGHEAQWAKRVLTTLPVESALGYLVGQAKHICGLLPKEIDENQIMNIAVWYQAVSSYFLLLFNVNFKKYHPTKVIDIIIHQADNILNIIHYIAKNKVLFNHLFRQYSDGINKINALFEKKFHQLRKNQNLLLSDSPTVAELFQNNTGDRTELDEYLNGLAWANLALHHYMHVSGWQIVYQNLHSKLFTVEKIMQTRLDFFDRQSIDQQWSDANGFIHPHYYETLRTEVMTIHGEQKLLAIVRHREGIQVCIYEPTINIWGTLADWPEWSDAKGYTARHYYHTIRTEVIMLNGEQKLLAMMRGDSGLLLIIYDPISNTWRALADWTALADARFIHPHYYETIRTEIITIHGEQKLLAMVRAGQGLLLSLYDPLRNIWRSLADWPAWSDDNGYAAQHYYHTIRTEVIMLNGEQKLLAMMRGGSGLLLIIYDPISNTWRALADWTALADAGFIHPHYYETIRTEIITIHSEQKILAMVRDGLGLLLGLYDPVSNTWRTLARGPEWSDANRYTNRQYFETIRTEIIMLNGEQKLLAMVRGSTGLLLNLYDPISNTWKELVNGPAWSDTTEYAAPKCYQTIRTEVMNIADNHQELIIMIRGETGIVCYQYKVAPHYLPTRAIAAEGFLHQIGEEKIQHEMGPEISDSMNEMVLHLSALTNERAVVLDVILRGQKGHYNALDKRLQELDKDIASIESNIKQDKAALPEQKSLNPENALYQPSPIETLVQVVKAQAELFKPYLAIGIKPSLDNSDLSYPTAGGGDCAFHAVLGEWNQEKGIYECKDVTAQRSAMAKIIKNSSPSSKIYELIRHAIEAMIMDEKRIICGDKINELKATYEEHLNKNDVVITRAWNHFKQELDKNPKVLEYIKQQNIKGDLKNQFLMCLNKNEEELYGIILPLPELNKAFEEYKTSAKQEFVWTLSPDIIKEYAAFIEKPGNSLLSLELQIMAYAFKITIIYHTKNCKTGQISNSITYNEGCKTQVSVLFNGLNHFERMPSAILQPEESKQTPQPEATPEPEQKSSPVMLHGSLANAGLFAHKESAINSGSEAKAFKSKLQADDPSVRNLLIEVQHLLDEVYPEDDAEDDAEVFAARNAMLAKLKPYQDRLASASLVRADRKALLDLQLSLEKALHHRCGLP